MEVIIPPRDHGQTTYRYTWDDNGEVERVERVNDADRSSVRQTMQWPFAHARTNTGLSNPLSASGPRRATWQAARALRSEDSPSIIEKDLIPDYVINYLRGETPETLARKRELRSMMPPGIGMPDGGRGGDFYSEDSGSRTTTSQEDTERILPGSRAGRRNSRRGSKDSDWSSWAAGWRGGVVLNTAILFAVLILAVVFLALSATGAGRMLGGENVLFRGSCHDASSLSWGLHAAINVVVVVLVAVANYIFQVLSSPTRQEISSAHDYKQWLDIGIPSFRNLGVVASYRVVLAVVLLLAALSTQVIYNAVIFTSHTGVPYDVVFVTQAFLAGAPFTNTSSTNAGQLSQAELLTLQDMATQGQLVNLTTSQCLDTFGAGGPADTGFTAVLLVTNLISQAGSLVQTGVPGANLAAYVTDDAHPDAAMIADSAVQFCLAQADATGAAAADATCAVTANGTLLGVVAILNLVSVLAAAAVLVVRRRTFMPLVTIGDAIASFLDEPDYSTQGTCLLTKEDVSRRRWGFREAKYWAVTGEHLWLFTPSVARWIVWGLAWTVPAGLAAAALGISVRNGGVLSPFGGAGASVQGNSTQVVYIFPPGTTRMGLALLAALPQLLLAVLYLCTNALLSTYYVSHELSQFARPGAALPLRVSASRGVGVQTSSLYLTLPRPLSWALLVLFSGMAFVLSQSVFVASADQFADATKTMDASQAQQQPAASVSAFAFSGVGLLTLLALLVALAALVLGLGLRRADATAVLDAEGRPAGNPLVLRGGTCSAVISARCHRLEGEADAAGRPLAWGVVREGTGMEFGHAAFSSRGVRALDLQRSYA